MFRGCSGEVMRQPKHPNCNLNGTPAGKQPNYKNYECDEKQGMKNTAKGRAANNTDKPKK